MKQNNKTIAGLIFMAAMSVYSGSVAGAAPGRAATPAGGATKNTGVGANATEVRLLDESPAATAAATTAKPGATGAAADVAAPHPVQPEGRSVSKSEVAVSDEGTVEIHVNDASLVEVLRMLSLQSQKNIICSREVRGTVTANLYNVTIREALDQILHMNGYAYREKGSFINVYTVKELKTLEEAERRTTTEVFRLFYTPAVNAMTMVKPVLSTAGQVSATTPAASGIAAGGETGGNNHAVEDMLVVTDYPENLDRVRKVLKDVDRRPQQVLVEATILRAALSEDNALGVDFNVLAGVKFDNVLSNAAGQITGANMLGSGVTPSANSFGTGNNFSSTIPGGFKVGVVTDHVSIFLAALEGVTDTVVMANPKVLALNKQKGEVIVGRKDGYLTTTVTESATVQTVEFLDTGTKLIFRPYIGDDGYIRMELHPEDSSGGLTGANLPFKITTEMTSNIMVKDGHTVVIGGLFRESSDTAKNQVPFLGNLPLAGPLFRNQRDRTTREEIIILLTPSIIKDEVVYGQMSEEQIKRGEKMRVGVRKGMMCWGRERLAEGSYEQAQAELAKAAPNRQRVLWHLDSAINLNPKFIEAVELKQKVTGSEFTTVDNSSIRNFVRRMVLAEKVTPSAPPAGTKTDSAVPAAPANKPANPTASSGDSYEDHCNPAEVAQEWGQCPVDGENCDRGEPDADRVVTGDTSPAAPENEPKAPAQSPVAPAAVAATPSTRPSQPVVSQSDKAAPKSGTPGEIRVTVTELPLEEVKPSPSPSDENK